MDAGFARFLSFSAARQWLARVNLVLFGPAILRKCPFAIVERCVMVSVLVARSRYGPTSANQLSQWVRQAMVLERVATISTRREERR
jgi:hypothetical protein